MTMEQLKASPNGSPREAITPAGQEPVNILPRLIRQAEARGGGYVITPDSDLSELVSLSEGQTPVLPNHYEDVLREGGSVLIDYKGNPTFLPPQKEK